MKGFLYGQTEYNILQNACHLEEYVLEANLNHFDYLTITDSNMHGHLKFYNLCKKYGIKPVIGLEIILENKGFLDTFLLYAQNKVGYHNLVKIATLYSLGKLTVNELSSNKEGLIIILSINYSILKTCFLQNEANEAINNLKYYQQYFNYYLGYSRQIEELIKINDLALVIGRDLEIKTVYVHQLLYLKKEDYVVYEALKKIENTPIKYQGDFAFLKDFSKIEKEVLDNTNELIETINLSLLDEVYPMPKYGANNAKDKLKEITYKGLTKRLLHYNLDKEAYFKRLDYELSIINEMDYNDYFLIVYDFILYAKKSDILVGPGRGSAAGSLVAFSLGITEVDPLKYGLLFERFLNKERVTMPDIDTDFPDNKRDMVIDYVKERYGKDKVCSITTYGTFSKKSIARDLARIMKIDNKRIKELTKMLDDPNLNEIMDNYKGQKDVYDFLYIARRLDGLPRNVSTHAAGIIISSLPLTNIIPLQEGPNNLLQSQLEYDDIKPLGLLKMDFLGLKNLTIIKNILDEINKDQKFLRNINLNDKNVLNLLAQADTLGIFQLESNGIRNVLKKLKPTNFNDLVATLALYRPGPMENIDEYIERKHGKPYTLINNDLKSILEETYGIIVYQEQVMEIARKFAGFSLGEADILRRAISKKDDKELAAMQEKFIKGSLNKGYSLEVAKTIYDYIYKFANYGFNKSHSVAYAMVAYQMAYLKTYYFPNFMANILDNVIGSSETTEEYIEYAKKHNLNIYPIDINISTNRFTFKNNGLYLPLTLVSGIGEETAKAIQDERKKGLFTSFRNFKERIKLPRKLNENLVYVDAFNKLEKNKAKLISECDDETFLINKYLTGYIEKEIKEYEEEILEAKEKECLGFNLIYNPNRYFIIARKKYKGTFLIDLKETRNYKVWIKLKNIKESNTKLGHIMYQGIAYDETLAMRFVYFDPNIKIDLNTIYYAYVSYKTSDKYGSEIIINEIINKYKKEPN